MLTIREQERRGKDTDLPGLEGVVQHQLGARQRHALRLVHRQSPRQLERELHARQRATLARLEGGVQLEAELLARVEAHDLCPQRKWHAALGGRRRAQHLRRRADRSTRRRKRGHRAG